MKNSDKSLKEFNRLIFISLMLLVLVCAFVLFKYNSIKSAGLQEKKEILKSILWQFNIQKLNYSARDDLSEIELSIKNEEDIKPIIQGIEDIANKYNCVLEQVFIGEQDANINLKISISRDKEPITSIGIVKEKKKIEKHYKEIAIIIDDAGYGGKLTEEFIKFPGNLTISVLPCLTHSRDIAKKIFDAGKEVMLHMPMEPEEFKSREITLMKYEIMIGMGEQEIYTTIDRMLATVPFAVGINNHQGSRATSDRRTMKFVLNKVKEDGLFFVDSLTSPNSVTEELAKFLGVPYATRDIFLDNKNEYYYIKSQMEKLIEIAEKKGKALGIGHINRENTLKVLSDILPELKQKNIQLVFASELVKKFNHKEVN